MGKDANAGRFLASGRRLLTAVGTARGKCDAH
jgi:hypothetical protein